MIETQTFDSYPVFGDNGTKAAPDAAKYAAGFTPSDVLPAEWMNWAWNHNTKGITALNTGLKAVEEELNAILTAGGQVPNGTSGQVLLAIQYVIQTKTGNLANLNTTAKSTIVAACNEILSALNTHKADHTNPHQVGGSQLSDPVPTSKIADGAITSPKINDSVYTYARVLYGECSTEAGTQQKEVTIPNLTTLTAGIEIRVKFTNDNTAGTCVGTQSNKIAADVAPLLKVNNLQAYPIKMGGEYVGEGFIQAGDVHNFMFDGSAWNDMTGDTIYQGSTTTGNYAKKRNLLITQWGVLSASENRSIRKTATFPIRFSNTSYSPSMAPIMWSDANTQRIAWIGVGQIQATSMQCAFYGNGSSDTGSGIRWNATGY